jgi:hypothetical protein
VLATIAEMPTPDRVMAERLHALITANAPALSPRTWYGMPAYAKDGNVVCHMTRLSPDIARLDTLGRIFGIGLILLQHLFRNTVATAPSDS